MKVLLAVFLLLPFMVFAKDNARKGWSDFVDLTETIDDVTWRYSIKDGVASVRGAVVSNDVSTIVIPSKLGGCPVLKIKNFYVEKLYRQVGKNLARQGLKIEPSSVIISEGVTSIESAFSRWEHLESVVIPSTVTNIGERAFLTCGKLKSVVIPEGVKSIGMCAFSDCDELTKVSIPSTLEQIGLSAFSSCRGLQEFVVDGANMKYSSVNGMLCTKDGKCLVRGVNGSVTIPGCVESIDRNAFSGSGITEVTIPESVAYIGQDAFGCCFNLTNVTICGVDVDFSCRDLFHGCDKLASIHVPVNSLSCSGMTTCEDVPLIFHVDGYDWQKREAVVDGRTWSFLENNGRAIIVSAEDGRYNCAVTPMPKGDLVIPSRMGDAFVTKIGRGAFADCEDLTSVKIPSCVVSIAKGAFGRKVKAFDVDAANANYSSISGMLCSKDGKTIIQGVDRDVEIPNGIANIGQCAFEGCTGVTTLTMPQSVVKIGQSAFSGCSGLKTVSISPSVTSIPFGVFSECSKLASIAIPGSVKDIEIFAFLKCSELTSATISNGVEIVTSGAFHDCGKLQTVKLPSSVRIVEENSFSDCPALDHFVVDEENCKYCAIDGALCSKDGKKLIFPGKGGGVIPPGIVEIGDFAFEGRRGISTVKIPASVKKIGGPDCFSGCSGLKEFSVDEANASYSSTNGLLCSKDGKTVLRGVNGDVIIPPGVESIDSWAFVCCSNLTSVTISSTVTNIVFSRYDPSRLPGHNRGCNKATITNLVTYVFMRCPNLKEIRMERDGNVESVPFLDIKKQIDDKNAAQKREFANAKERMRKTKGQLKTRKPTPLSSRRNMSRGPAKNK